jgi:hypothetical protein
MSRRRAALFACLISLPLVACGSLIGERQPIDFYTLTSVATAEPAPPPVSTGSGMIAVQTVRLPEYLNQRSIVTRGSANEIRVAPHSQWAGTLDDNITRVLVEDLSKALGSERIVGFPVSPAVPVDRVVQVDIARFEADARGRVELTAQWFVFGEGGRNFIATGRSNYVTDADATEYAVIAGAMSRLLVDLGRDIVAALRAEGGTPRPLS